MARKHRLVKGLAVVALAATALSGIAVSALYGAIDGIDKKDITNQLGENRPDAWASEEGAPINIVMMGSDTREGQGSGFGKNVSGQRSDTTIFVHISGDRTWATAVSIPRDTTTVMPDCINEDGSINKGWTDKFNVTMSRAGPGCVVKTLEEITNIRVDHYVVVNFKGFQNVVDAVGGVEVCLTDSVDDEKSHLQLPAGLSTLDGKTALAFVRARKTLGDGSDISRIRRQQDFLASLARKTTSAGVLLNPKKVLDLINAIAGSLTTDPELGSVDGIKTIAMNLQDLRPSNIRFITAPNAPDPDNTANVKLTPEADELWDALRADKQWPTPPDNGPDGKPLTVAPEDIKIAVLNGTATSGLAGAKADLFSALGYTIAKTDNTTEFFGTETAVWVTKARENEARTVAAALGLNKIKVFKKQNADDPSLVVVVGSKFTDPRELKIKTKPSSSLYGPKDGRAADETDCSPA